MMNIVAVTWRSIFPHAQHMNDPSQSLPSHARGSAQAEALCSAVSADGLQSCTPLLWNLEAGSEIWIIHEPFAVSICSTQPLLLGRGVSNSSKGRNWVWGRNIHSWASPQISTLEPLQKYPVLSISQPCCKRHLVWRRLWGCSLLSQGVGRSSGSESLAEFLQKALD